MKLIITEEQYKLINELITKDEVFCDRCNWSWELANGGNDPYICHKCGHNNEKSK